MPTEETKVGAGLRGATGVLLLIGLVTLVAVTEGTPNVHTTPDFARYWMWGLFGAAIAGAPPVRRGFVRLLHAADRAPAIRVVGPCAVAAFGWALFAAWGLFDGVPALDDDVAALFQARIFAAGRLTLPLPEQPEFFEVFGVLSQRAGADRWAAMYPPGLSIVLLPGVVVGAPWIVNPILAAVLVGLVYLLGRDVFDSRTGKLSAVLVSVSPYVLVLSGTHLSHVSTAVCLTLATWAVWRLLSDHRAGWGALAGAAWAMAFLSRPLTSIVVGAATALGALIASLPRRVPWGGVLVGIATASTGCVTLLAWQELTTGDPFVAGHQLGMKKGKFGFGDVGGYSLFTFDIGFRSTLERLRAIHDDLFGFPLPAFAAAVIPFLLRRGGRRELWLMAPFVALASVYTAWWYFEVFYPGRYLFEGLPMLIVVMAHGMVVGGERLRRLPRLGRLAPTVALGGLVGIAYGGDLPHRLEFYDSEFGDVEHVLPRVVEKYDIDDAIVFVDSVGRCDSFAGGAFNDYFATAFLRNDLDLDGPVVYARNLKAHNVELMKRHPGRTYYLYRYKRCEDEAALFRLVPDEEPFRVEPVGPDVP